MQYPFSHLFLLLFGILFFPHDTPIPARVARPPGDGIRTSNDYTVETLVNDIFAKGACNNISNIRGIGNAKGIGYFEKGKNIIGMERGIMIATGPIEHASGPNQSGDRSGNFDDATGDPDLGRMSTHAILDAVGIEFDFVPLDSFVRFRYVFASEEYCEFVGSVYNDVFGFFVSGPGIEGTFSRNSKNVALIPGTNANVAINSVNHQQNSDYFIRNELKRDAEQCGITPINSPYQELIEYDGFTKILTANLQLIPCQTYHIRFMVSDVADRHYDSAVFLEAESFNIGGTVLLNAKANNGSTATEGCENSAFVFERGEKENLDKPLTVQIKISEESTATEGTDFQSLPRIVTIPAGQLSAKLPVQIINDNIPESPEKLTIELDIPCACYSGTASLTLTDAPALSMQLPDGYACRSAPTTLTPQITGGTPPYTYRWSNGGTSPSLNITAGAVGNYSVTVADQCGNIAIDSNKVTPIEPPSATLSGSATICAGDTAYLQVDLIGTPPWRLTYSVNGDLQPPIESIQQADFQLPASLDGFYKIEKIEDAGCAGTATGVGQLEIMEIQIASTVQAATCTGAADGNISITPTGGALPLQYQWSQNLGRTKDAANLKAGNYQLTVTDAKGCADVFEFTILEPLPLSPVVFNCEDLTNADFTFAAKGGTPPYRYSTDGITYSDASLFRNLEPGKTVSLIIKDNNDCVLQQALTMPPLYDQMVTLPKNLELNIGEMYEFQPTLNIATNLIAKIEWRGEGLSCTDCLHPTIEALQATTYTIQITDIFGCVGQAAVKITLDPDVDVFIPSAFSPNGDRINDFFTLYADPNQVQMVLSMLVFDRWGNQVFTNSNFLPGEERTGWNGTINGKPATTGVFVYVARLQLRDGSESIRKGHLLLVR